MSEHLAAAQWALRAAQWGDIMRLAAACQMIVTYSGQYGNIDVRGPYGFVGGMGGDVDYALKSTLTQMHEWVNNQAPEWMRERVKGTL